MPRVGLSRNRPGVLVLLRLMLCSRVGVLCMGQSLLRVFVWVGLSLVSLKLME